MKKQDLIDLLGQNIEVSDYSLIRHDGVCMVVRYAVRVPKEKLKWKRAVFELDRHLVNKLIDLHLVYRYDDNVMYDFKQNPVRLSQIKMEQADARKIATMHEYKDALQQSGTALHKSIDRVVNMFSGFNKQTA